MSGDIFRQPKNTMPRINSIYAFVSVDPADGNEGLLSLRTAPVGGAPLPLVAADEARLASIRPIAEHIAETTGMKIKLVKFTTREEIEEL